MKYLLTIPIAIFLLTMVPLVNAQTGACPVCPNGQAPLMVQPQVQPQPTYIQPQQPVVVQQPSLTIQNITSAITAALDPIQKHLMIIDGQIVNITTVLEKLQTQPTAAPTPLPQPTPLPPPTNNQTQPLPPPPPPGQDQQQGQQSSCPFSQQPSQQGSSCPNSGGGPGGYQMGPPINQYFYPGGGEFGPLNHFGGNFNGGHHGGHH